jgi:exodeoxyribonuclease VII small subunit
VAKKKTVKTKPAEQTRDADQSGDQPIGFEQSLREVEMIVGKLESGELTLDQSLKAYEQGVRSLRRCHDQLGKVERQIELLVGFDDAGMPVTRPFDQQAEGTMEEKRARRGQRRGATATGQGDADDSATPRGEDRDCDDDGSRVDDSPGLF